MFASVAGTRAVEGLAPFVLVILVAAVLLYPFRRKIGGEGGGSEKGIVGALWVLAALVITLLLVR